METSLVLLLATWLIVVPWLVLFPPRLALLRQRWRAAQQRRTLRGLRLVPSWTSAAQGGKIVVPKNRRTVLVVVNKRSGGQAGALLLSEFKKLLAPAQIVDVTEEDPVTALERFQMTGDNIRILVCGGDGTVGWVMNAAAGRRCRMPIAVLPLGTGNDLSRSFGWGKGVAPSKVSPEFLSELLVETASAKLRLIDRWSLTFADASGTVTKTVVMMNYFSLGIDAEIALKFHNEREAHPERFTSQERNVARYAMYGFEGAFEGQPLGEGLFVTADGTEVSINENWKGMIVSNVPVYHGGKDFWGQCDPTSDAGDDFGPVSVNDGRLEVMGLSGTLHIGLVHLAMDQALRLGQAHSVRIRMETPYAVQVDGEPWRQEPGTLTFALLDQYPMLMREQAPFFPSVL